MEENRIELDAYYRGYYRKVKEPVKEFIDRLPAKSQAQVKGSFYCMLFSKRQTKHRQQK